MQERICCFTGHRQLPAAELPSIVGHLMTEIYRLMELGVNEFRSGGALGFDLLAAECVLSARDRNPGLKLCMRLPCPEQDKYWPESEKRRYRHILSLANQVSYSSDHYFTGCMHLRNRCLVEGSAYCIAYLYENGGGTRYTVEYALRNGLVVINLAEKSSG